jgi:hypothetical protein
MKKVENDYRSKLSFLSINKDCSSPSATCVAYLPEYAIQKLSQLKSACGDCKITITGGTEPAPHASHGINIAVVDLRNNSEAAALNNFVIKLQIKKGEAGPFTQRYCWGDVMFGAEGDHWHVIFGPHKNNPC